MTQIEQLKKDLDCMLSLGDDISRKLENIGEKEKKDRRKNLDGLSFPEIVSRGSAYRLKGHQMAMAKEAEKILYIRSLAFVTVLLRPYSEDWPAGLAALERIRQALDISGNLQEFLADAYRMNQSDILSGLDHIRSGAGYEAFLLDSLVLSKEMKASAQPALESLSRLYALLGYGERTLAEALEALGFVYEGNRMAFMLAQSAWIPFSGEAASCYLDLADNLNLDGFQSEREHYAIWPERSKYVPRFLLEIHATEGSQVKKDDVLFTLYGLGEKYKNAQKVDDFLGGGNLYGFTIKYAESPSWIYLMQYNPSIGDRYKSWFCSRIDNMKEGAVSVSVKALSDGILHWNPCLSQEPFACISNLSYRAGESHIFSADEWTDGEVLVKDKHYHAIYWSKHCGSEEPNPPVTDGDIFASGISLTPEALRQMPLCVVARQ